jgi:hypothetical protein
MIGSNSEGPAPPQYRRSTANSANIYVHTGTDGQCQVPTIPPRSARCASSNRCIPIVAALLKPF